MNHSHEPILMALCEAVDGAAGALTAHLRAGARDAWATNPALAQTLALCRELAACAEAAAGGDDNGAEQEGEGEAPKKRARTAEQAGGGMHLLQLPRPLLLSMAIKFVGAKVESAESRARHEGMGGG